MEKHLYCQLAGKIHERNVGHGARAAERRTHLVIWITVAMMVAEIGAGWWSNSMALLADGWHMSSHALAIGLSAFAYAAARRYAADPRFAFGTWKIEILAGYTSAIFLLVIAAMMVAGSLERLFRPEPVHYAEAIAVAGLGLAVNVVCALILGGAHQHDHHHDHHHHHDHDHGHGHGHRHGSEHGRHGAAGQHQDLNLRAAYVHVMADAATSALAIVALAGGWFFGWAWLDPATGIVGALLVALWAKNLLADTGKVLLDREMDAPVVDEIRAAAEAGGATLTDLHVWRVGRNAYACALAVTAGERTLAADGIRQRLAQHDEIVHSTIEIQSRDRTPD